MIRYFTVYFMLLISLISIRPLPAKANQPIASYLSVEQGLATLFQSSPPEYIGADNFFFESDLEGLDWIAVDKEIKFGQSLQQLYKNHMKQTFGHFDNDIWFAELGLKKKLLLWMQPIERRRQDIPIKEIEARRQALAETLLKYSYPQSVTLSQLENWSRQRHSSLRNQQIRASEAISFYRRTLFAILTLREQRETHPVEITVERLRNKSHEYLNLLRLLNLQGHIHYLLTSPKVADVRFPEGITLGRATEIKFQDLLHAKWEVSSAPLFEQVNPTQFSPNEPSADANNRMSRDARLASQNYQNINLIPQDNDVYFNFETSEGEKGTFSSQAMQKFLWAIRPVEVSTSSSNKMTTQRFLIESYYRDYQLASLSYWMRTTRFQSKQHLLSTLEKRSQKIKNSVDRRRLSSLSNLVLRYPSLLNEENKSWFWWSQIAQNPNYWQMRDEIAQRLNRPQLIWSSGLWQIINSSFADTGVPQKAVTKNFTKLEEHRKKM